MMYDVLIIGAGPGGLQAAIAAASEGLKVLVLEKGTVGGQIGQTPLLENSVFANGGITGPQFARMMRAQTEAMGAEIRQGEALALIVNPPFGMKKVLVKFAPGVERPVYAHTVVLAMGNRWRHLGIPGVKAGITARKVFYGPVESINYNATGRDVAVYGGGPSAGQAILALAGQANTRVVHVLMRSTLNMPHYLVDRIHEQERAGKVALYGNTVIDSVRRLSSGLLGVAADANRQTLNIRVDALFMCNGLEPATDWLPSRLLNGEGRVLTNAETLETEVPGVYAVGDCRSGSTPRVGVAIGDGSMAVTSIWRYFAANPQCQRCKEILK